MSEKKEVQKKEYEKPAIIHRQILESIAGACDTADPINGKADANSCQTINS